MLNTPWNSLTATKRAPSRAVPRNTPSNSGHHGGNFRKINSRLKQGRRWEAENHCESPNSTAIFHELVVWDVWNQYYPPHGGTLFAQGGIIISRRSTRKLNYQKFFHRHCILDNVIFHGCVTGSRSLKPVTDTIGLGQVHSGTGSSLPTTCASKVTGVSPKATCNSTWLSKLAIVFRHVSIPLKLFNGTLVALAVLHKFLVAVLQQVFHNHQRLKIIP